MVIKVSLVCISGGTFKILCTTLQECVSKPKKVEIRTPLGNLQRTPERVVDSVIMLVLHKHLKPIPELLICFSSREDMAGSNGLPTFISLVLGWLSTLPG